MKASKSEYALVGRVVEVMVRVIVVVLSGVILHCFRKVVSPDTDCSLSPAPYENVN